MSVKTPPPLPADLTAGLRRLKLATIRQLAPELLLTAKTQRWAPEEVLRTLIEAEVAARDGVLHVTPHPPKGSHDLAAYARGTALVRVRAGAPPARAGAGCEVLILTP